MLFAGFLRRPDQIPGWIRWLQWISMMKYSFADLAIDQFKVRELEFLVYLSFQDQEFVCLPSELSPEGTCPITNGNQVLEQLNINPV